MIKVDTDSQNIAVISFEVTDKPMNVVNEHFLNEFSDAIKGAISNQNTSGVIITSNRPEFIAGADLELITKIKDAKECYALTDRFHKLFRKLETSGIPFVAAINGTALGGGYEVALACHYRVALQSSKTKIGLPEVTLGLLPGGGGTQRLSRMLGLQNSLPFLLQGKTLSPEKALKAGLVDDIAQTKEEMISKAKAWIIENPKPTQPWDDKKFRLPGGEVQSPKGYQVLPAATAMLTEKTFGNFPAAKLILRCLYEGLQVPFDLSLKVEARHFAKAVLSKESRLMIRSLFYSMNECNKGAARPDVKVSPIKKVGILGAGMMGAGIAYSSAKAGIEVILKDISQETAEKGKAYSASLLDKAIEKGRATLEDKEKHLSLITPTCDPAAVKDCDLVIEAVIEDRDIKAAVTKETEAVTSENSIFASNTSTLPITGLAKASARPQNFIGLHFFSPVDKMPLVEIIMGEQSSPEALAACIDYTRQIKKTPIVVNDGRGFYTSRCFTTYIIEGICALTEGVNPSLIEMAGKAAGMPVGPLSIADEVSIDLIYHILKQTAEDLGEDQVEPNTYKVATKFVTELKRLGRKNKQGFYDYPEDGPKHLSPILSKLFPVKEDQPSLEHLKRRFLTIQTLETARCLEEKILTHPRDADIGSILGWGFPPYTGGSLSYVEWRGPHNFRTDCNELEEKYGPRFKAPRNITSLDESFYDD
ncbi:MAG: 3-hydroxyacyl-CoA dehydrogenase [Halobacteriovorax sp.]|nr:3-hydroxyacyl-CoA dehydrogenase [Halobacteriovorax sp.]|tara:strand:- start:96114 stop:98228 length:2115 start_codon:yes stop_codon:yes gene_type:complete